MTGRLVVHEIGLRSLGHGFGKRQEPHLEVKQSIISIAGPHQRVVQGWLAQNGQS